MKRRRTLTPDEDALWRETMRDVRPIKRKRARKSNLAPAVRETAAEKPPPARTRLRDAAQPPAPAPAPARVSKGRALPALKAGDPALDRKARRGRIEIERTLDLHGLREASAHTRLKSFVETAARDGCRCVLVITGKGARKSDDYEERPRGVIRRRFEDWIEEEPVRSVITRAAPAQQRDGGAGAFYLFLKGRGKTKTAAR